MSILSLSLSPSPSCFSFPSVSSNSSSLPKATATTTTTSFNSNSISTLLRACKTSLHLCQLHAHIIRKGLITLSSPSPSPSPLFPIPFPSSTVFADLEGSALHGSVLRCGVERDLFIRTSLIDFYGKCKHIFGSLMVVAYKSFGDLEKAKRLFNEMPQRNVASWNAIICGLVKLGDLKGARRMFNEMPERDVVSYSTMIDGCAKAGDMASARFLFELVPQRDIFGWSTLILGYTKSVDSRDVKPNEFVMVSLMSACSQIGNLELAKWVDSYVSRAQWIFNNLMMRYEYSLLPSPNHYACMVDLLSKVGRLKAAYELINSMLMEPHAGAWGALLGPCKLHCNIELGQVIAAHLLELEPHNAGNYVSLSNIYVAADWWLDVSFVSKKMMERGVRKITGHSCIYS
ncbi:hypothetical protein ACB098_12G154000 [Castanea mollissima]